MRKWVLLAAMLAALLTTAAAPAYGQEPGDQYARSTASLEPVNVYGFSVAGCEVLLSEFGVEEQVTFGTPPEQVWYCLSVVLEVPPAAPAADGEPLIGDLPCPDIPGAIVDCVDQDEARALRALEAAGVYVAGDTFPPPRILPETGGPGAGAAAGLAAPLAGLGPACLLVRNRTTRQETTTRSPED